MTDVAYEHQNETPSEEEAPAAEESAPAPQISVAGLKGKITVADEVVEKVTALAAMQVPGVADLGGDLARAFESVRDRIGFGSKRANQGVKAEIQDGMVAIDITIVILYGHVVMEVAAEVQSSVATSVAQMLGMEVVEVNVTVDDVRLPGEGKAEEAAA
ncbi:Asp23/Gls24 family envelope stress response protein [Herbidospora yilanensis]|uniref:Asp23/Gls24 family envelope stress response protein n=1 Tax=Herbidospora yilanensis TaxID=354426 RepID=UPI000780801D|nr:Asp23/Gls24 family envelope stress response protein [Herbidospora yilanensis]